MSGIVTKDYTTRIQKVIREVVNDPKTFLGSKYLPSVALDVSKVYVDVMEASGGMTNEHTLGTSPQYIQGVGNRSFSFEPGYWKESLNYNEKDIIYLRQLGKTTDDRGIKQKMDADMDKLNRRVETRIEHLRWRSIFDGGFSYKGRTVSFGVPTANKAAPIGAMWSLDGLTANNAANPIEDLRHWLMGALGQFRKYNVSKIIMNPTTAQWILSNTNTKTFATSYAANSNVKNLDVNEILGFLFPGLPPVEIYKGWYQEETVVDGKVTVGNAIYFIKNGEIFFEVSNLPDGDKIGEFVQTLNLANGSIDQPGSGKFLVIDDCTAPGTRGGPQNPFIDVTAGVYGGPKIDRGFDLLTAYVSAV